VPQLIVDLYAAVCAGDLKRAMDIQFRINPLKDVVYGGGEPSGDAHARMKMAMYLAGIFKSPAVQPPTRLPSAAETEAIKAALREVGMLRKEAA
jgi:4-hydroxy-tetrahydrodipicolinate synthase